jgi:nicotinamidase-related amidase
MRRSLTLDPTRSALILVDLQQEQRHGGEYSVAGLDAVLANAAAILEAARIRQFAVIHAAYRRDFDRVPPRQLEFVTAEGKPAFSDKASALTAICAEVAPRAGEPVIHKNDASAFCEGDLAPRLRGGNVEWLIVCGVWTEACVAATVRDATAQGFRVLLVKDACGSGTKAMHQVGILNLANRLAGGAVADTGAAVRLIAGEAVEIWVAEKPVPILFDYQDAEQFYESL